MAWMILVMKAFKAEGKIIHVVQIGALFRTHWHDPANLGPQKTLAFLFRIPPKHHPRKKNMVITEKLQSDGRFPLELIVKFHPQKTSTFWSLEHVMKKDVVIFQRRQIVSGNDLYDILLDKFTHTHANKRIFTVEKHKRCHSALPRSVKCSGAILTVVFVIRRCFWHDMVESSYLGNSEAARVENKSNRLRNETLNLIFFLKFFLKN